MNRFWIAGLTILALLFAGCTPTAQEKSGSPSAAGQPVTVRPYQAQIAKKLAEKDPRVEEATAVSINSELSVGLKVSNFDRFFLKSTRKRVHGKLKHHFPGEEIHVTTDNKLFGELQKIAGFPADKQEVYQKLQKINEDMKG
ncbi:YhcN/YlaJ family sporulation lipoprotein [Paludifilum halophilum]|uniref:Sporulation protein n=1 Tax=Paludifilum halophilum TaxID=1642702 RepID=A0A235BA34_9BACL|nr:YhcN/YlaJ family sporulation lipoprotein [Paludifilum halophilum]OYD09126.1 hypothetical protein CHM34_05005 [Paludifilum halophilum]